MYLQLAEGENNGNYQALAEGSGVMDNYVFIPNGFLPEFDKDTYVRADYFNKFDPTTAEALLNALASTQTVGLSFIGVAAAASGGLKLAKNLIDKRKAAVAAGTKKPLFGPGGVVANLKDKFGKGAAMAPAEMQKDFPTAGGSVTLPGGTIDLNVNPTAQTQPSFLTKYKMPLIIGGVVLAAGGIYLATRKKRR